MVKKIRNAPQQTRWKKKKGIVVPINFLIFYLVFLKYSMLQPNKYPKSQAETTELIKPMTKRPGLRSFPFILVKSIRWNQDFVICIESSGNNMTKRRQTMYVTPIVRANAFAKTILVVFIIITSFSIWDKT